jgi:molecular chaperone GrpE
VSGGARNGDSARDPSGSEGWETLAEEAADALSANPELEAALREASEAIDDGGYLKRAEGPAAKESDNRFSSEEIERMAGQLVENRDKYVRLLADFDNFRRRAHKERQDILLYGHENLVKDLLSTVDNLDRAIEHAHQSDGGDLASLLQGVELVQRELYAVLAQHEVCIVDARGCQFDPTLHDAMAQVQDESVPANTVLEVLQKGFRLRDRMLRPARVVVAKGREDKDDAAKAE